MSQPPVVIGGVGGSGTRLIAEMLRACGLYIGGDLNPALDNRWWTELFRHEEILAADDAQFDRRLDVFRRKMTHGVLWSPCDWTRVLLWTRSRGERWPKAWLRRSRLTLLCPELSTHPFAGRSQWGWKEPNTHIVLDRLIPRLTEMHYIHVMRHGVDMAFSQNQNQLERWGEHLLGRPIEQTPHDSLAYWCAVHRRVLDHSQPLGERFWLLNFDELCAHPQASIERLLDVVGLDATGQRVEELSALVKQPSSIGRHREHPLEQFAASDLDFVREMGFDVGAR